ncbi:MAG: hypothetical protein JNN28_18090, partial [Saprospiraceae bacterium]|nr:hypothetical protein [Saprospiraceae bacterium]
MRKTILFGAAFLLLNTLFAQDSNPVVILQTTGKVSVVSKGKSKANPVSAGALANPASTLKLNKGASAVVLCNGQYITIKNKDKVDLVSVCGTAPAKRRLDVDHDLNEKVLAAVDMVGVAKARGDGWISNVTDPKKNGDGWGNNVTDPKKNGDGWGNNVTDPKKNGDGWGNNVTDPKKNGDGWGNNVTDPKKNGDGWGNNVTDPKKNGDGWGGKGSTIKALMPFGLVQKGLVCFNWSRPETKDPYRIEILDEKGTLIHAQSVKDTFVCMDLSGISLNIETPYTWRVKVDGAKTMVSNDLVFGIGNEKDREEALKYAAMSSNADNKELMALSKAI